MPLPLITGLIVLVVLIIVGAVAYLIDESTERHERTRQQ
jgi:preprotein translocase subunit SecE